MKKMYELVDKRIKKAEDLKLVSFLMTPISLKEGDKEKTVKFAKGGDHHLTNYSTSFSNLGTDLKISIFYFDEKHLVFEIPISLTATSGFQQKPVTALNNKYVKGSDIYLTIPPRSQFLVSLSRTLNADEKIDITFIGHQNREETR